MMAPQPQVMVKDGEIDGALARLFALAQIDTGQARRAANFLLAWWNGDDWGHFPLADLFGVDDSVAADITAVFRFLAQHPGAISAAAWGDRGQMIVVRNRAVLGK